MPPLPRPGAAAGRSYPVSEVRGGREELPHAPTPEARSGGWEELPHTQGQGQQAGGATPRPRSGGCAGAGGPRGAIPLKVRRGGGEEIPLLEGKEQGCALLEQP